MHLLELFSGTGSVGRAFEARGWRVTSVDLLPHFRPTICCDVAELRVEELPQDIDLVWGSPPCTHYSVARSKAKTPRDLEGSDRLVAKVLEIAGALGVPFLMENPHSGMLKGREVVAGLPMQIVDYCKYGCLYRKRTSIWTNTDWKPLRPLCNHDCAGSDGRKHLQYAQQAPDRKGMRRFRREELYALPEELCAELADWACTLARPS